MIKVTFAVRPVSQQVALVWSTNNLLAAVSAQITWCVCCLRDLHAFNIVDHLRVAKRLFMNRLRLRLCYRRCLNSGEKYNTPHVDGDDDDREEGEEEVRPGQSEAPLTSNRPPVTPSNLSLLLSCLIERTSVSLPMKLPLTSVACLFVRLLPSLLKSR